MTRTRQSFFGAMAAGILMATAVAAVAETFTLTVKRRETKPASPQLYWSVQPQYLGMQMTVDEKGRWRPAGQEAQVDAFKRIVKKEPKYQSENPFRGVVKFGSQEFAFALDAIPKAKKPDAKKNTPDAKKPAAKTKDTGAKDTGASDSADVRIVRVDSVASVADGETAAAAKPDRPLPKPARPVTDFSYNRLYFDFNRNGDLTDDKVIEAATMQSMAIGSAAMGYARFEFPRTDVTIDVEGTPVDYSFSLEGYAYSSADSCSVGVSVSSAICREGDITLEGKRHHVVLLDNNSNGRFDDISKIATNIRMASGQLYPEPGDILLLDPKTNPTAFDSPYDANSSDYRYPVAEMILIDGKYYDLKISPAGDKLTLTPATAALGSVTNRNETFRALIYGEGKGFLKIRGTKGTPVPVPAGQWKLFSYTITYPKAADKTAKATQGSLFAALGQMLGGGIISDGPTSASATATDKYKAVTVAKGETVEFPFGPPYTPTVTAASYRDPNAKDAPVYLEMSLVGVGGEACTDLTVKGARPGKPDFTITDPGGKVVQKGNFEYG